MNIEHYAIPKIRFGSFLHWITDKTQVVAVDSVSRETIIVGNKEEIDKWADERLDILDRVVENFWHSERNLFVSLYPWKEHSNTVFYVDCRRPDQWEPSMAIPTKPVLMDVLRAFPGCVEINIYTTDASGNTQFLVYHGLGAREALADSTISQNYLFAQVTQIHGDNDRIDISIHSA